MKQKKGILTYKSLINQAFYNNYYPDEYNLFKKRVAAYVTYLDSSHKTFNDACRRAILVGARTDIVMDIITLTKKRYTEKLKLAYGSLILFNNVSIDVIVNVYGIIKDDILWLIYEYPLDKMNSLVYEGIIPSKYIKLLTKDCVL